jgi:hypothetical protein
LLKPYGFRPHNLVAGYLDLRFKRGSGVLPYAAKGFVGGEALGGRKLAWAFFECSIYPLNSEQIRHKGGSKLPHSKAPSAQDRKTMRYSRKGKRPRATIFSLR